MIAAPHTGLQIPTLARAVPQHYRLRLKADGNKLARLAALLHELGILTTVATHRVRGQYPSEGEMIEQALAGWSRQVMGGDLQVLHAIALVVNPDGVDQYVSFMSNYGEEPEEDIDADTHVMFVLVPWDWGPVYVMQPRCEAIERHEPGLARTALRYLEGALSASALAFTPSRAAEFMEMYDGFEEAEEDALTWKRFAARFPKWVIDPYRARPLGDEVLDLLRHTNPVAAAVVEVKRALADHGALRPTIGPMWHTAYSCCLRWSEEDPVTRIADDVIRDAQAGGEGCDDYTMHPVKLEKRALSRFLDRFGRMLKILAAADRLLALIADPAR